MLRKVVVIGLLLVILIMSVHAEPAGVVPVDQTVTTKQINKYLSAEAAQHIDEQMQKVEQELKDYQDENLRTWDGRMHDLVSSMRMQFVVGGLGVMFLAAGIVAYVLMNHFKKYSYEAFLERMLEQSGQMEILRGQQPEQFQQRESYPQQPQQTLGMEYGQQWAAQQTQMNQWQTRPVYRGAWKAPVETQSEVSWQQQQQQFQENGGGF